MTGMKKRFLFCLTAAILLLFSCFVGMAVFADQTRDVTMVKVVINYYYYDTNEPNNQGDSPYPSFVANMPQNSPAISQRCPNVPGYEPYYENGDPVEGYVNVTFGEDYTINIFYHPANVPYTITLMKQNLEGTDYVEADVINGTGPTGSVPQEFGSSYTFPADYNNATLRNKTLENVYEGFTLMFHQPETIAADGSGEFECFYDRNYYQVHFDLGEGGYGVDPIYAPYEFPFPAISNPERAGFRFLGWYEKPDGAGEDYTPPADASPIDLPEKITKDVTYIALWQPITEVNYTIVYRNEALPDGSGVTRYDYWNSFTLEAYPGTVISVDDIIRDYNNNNRNLLEDFPFFALDEAKTKSENGETVSVRGDGSTIITLYYSRRSYELKFVYAREKVGQPEYPYQSTIQAFEDDEDFGSATGYYIIKTISDNSAHPALTATEINFTANNNSKAKGIQMYDTDDADNKDKLVKWKFQVVKDTNGDPIEGEYYVSPDTSPRQYLEIVNGNSGSQEVRLSDTKVALKVSYSGGNWTFKNIDQNYYLNDKRDQHQCATAYNAAAAGNNWKLSTEKEKVSHDSVYQITNATTGGIDPGNTSNSWWGLTIDSLPMVTLPTIPADQQSWLHLSLEHETKTFSGQRDTYEYYYISLIAPFNADIESAWPAAGFSPMTATNGNEYKFGSWGVEAGSHYFELYHTGENKCNIIGDYPIMSSELIRVGHEEEELAMTLYAWWGKTSDNIRDHTEHIYFESLDTPGTYEFIKDLVFQCAHNTNTYVNPFVYQGMEIHPDDDGNHSTKNSDELTLRYNRKPYTLTIYNYNTTLHTEPLRYGTPIEDILNPAYLSIDPPANSGIDTKNYTFKGWYTSQFHDDDELIRGTDPAGATGFTMPDHDVVLYAYWEPKTYTINYYNDEADYNLDQPYKHTETEQYGTYISSEHLADADNQLSPVQYTLSDGTVEYAARVGWFYKDSDGVEHAFKPESMTVSGNMDLYMKWSTTVPAYFKVEYIDKTEGDHYNQKVAGDTLGYSFVGLTRVFHAKVDSDLNPGYTEHYFPYVESTSILLRSDSSLNYAVFHYAYRDKVGYQVRYVTVEDGVERQLLPTKTVPDNSKTVVTEKYVPVSGYIPTAYYLSQRLVIKEGMGEDELLPENVITFYYQADDRHLPYYVSYELENEQGDEELTFTWHGSEKTLRFKGESDITSMGERGAAVSVPVLTFPGYEYAGYGEIVSYDDNGVIKEEHLGFTVDDSTPTALSFLLSDDRHSSLVGKEFHLHYVKKTYPVTVNYRVSSDHNGKIKEWNEAIRVLDIDGLTPDTETAVEIDGTTCYTSYSVTTYELFGSSFTKVAPSFDGFRLSGTPEATLIVSDDPVGNTNTIFFTYNELEEVMYYYRAILPDRTGLRPAITDGLLRYNQESVEKDTDPELAVNAQQYALNKKGDPDPTIYRYEFEGWYMDEACTVPVPEEYYPDPADRYTIQPKWINPAADRYFYAHYDYIRGEDLVITTAGCLEEDDLNKAQCFEYRVVGKNQHNEWIDIHVLIPGNGSRTVKGLPIGDYEVIPTDWAWRYLCVPDKVPVVITQNEPARADFSRTMIKPIWLDGNAYQETPEN